MSVDAEHVLVCGPSGGGKTTYLRELHARHDGPSIFLTTKKYESTAVDNPPLRIRRSSSRYPDDIRQSREWARAQDPTVQVIIDEAQNAPTFRDGQEGPTYSMLHEDRSSGVKAVVATQNPMDMRSSEHGYGPIQQCKHWVFVGPARDWHESFFNANGMSDLKPYMPTENYQYVVFEPSMAKAPEEKILFRGETKERYG